MFLPANSLLDHGQLLGPPNLISRRCRGSHRRTSPPEKNKLVELWRKIADINAGCGFGACCKGIRTQRRMVGVAASAVAASFHLNYIDF